MADTPPFESPVVEQYPLTTDDTALTLADASATTKLIVRADAGTAAAAQLGVVFGSSRIEGDVLISGQRPDEWTIVGTAGAARAIVDDLDGSGHVSVIDHTHGRALFRLTGDDAARTLEKLCNLDWHDDMTPDGAATSASLAAVTCDIVRRDRLGTRSYLVACDRSFGQYLFDAVLDAGREFGIAVVRE